VIELAILGLLKEGALHGYELKKRLRDVVGARSAVSFGSLYPALNRLERDGAVAAVAAGGDGRATTPTAMPMTGSFTGEAAAFHASRRAVARGPRNKKVYGITSTGEARLAELISDPADDERSFPVKLAFCRFTDQATRLRLLERRRAALVQRLGEGQRTMGARGDRLDRYVRSLLEHDTESTERDIAWLDRLLDRERSQPAASPADAAAVPPAPAAPGPATPASPTFPTHPHTPPTIDGTKTTDKVDGGSR
jgi:DNA-binding PadR family transcriptional regulator